MKKGIVALLVIGLVSMAFCAWSPGAKAQPDSVEIDESPHTHSTRQFVPEETMTITVSGPEDDIYDIVIVYDRGGADLQMTDWEDQTVPESGEIVLSYDVPASAASLERYWVEVWDETRVVHYWWVDYWFDVVLFRAELAVERENYIAGEDVTAHYRCWYVKDNGAVTDGFIDWLAEDDATNTEIESGSITLNDPEDAVGSFTFSLSTGASPGPYTIYFWLNDTSSGTPDHIIPLTAHFEVQTLIVLVALDGMIPPPDIVYEPGQSVRVDVIVILDIWDWEPVAGAEVDIEVREDGDVVDAYGADGLVTKDDGRITHYFTLDDDIDDGTEFEVEAEVSLEVVTERQTIEFTVEEEAEQELSVNLKFDRNIYLTGETITATAEVQTRGTTGDINYRFEIRRDNSGGTLLFWSIQTVNVLQWTIPLDFEGDLYFEVDAKNAEGFDDDDHEVVAVVYGHLLVDATPTEYEAGDTITISFELVSNIMTDPEFNYIVSAAGIPIESGPAGLEEFTFDIPSIPADTYTFAVIAVDDGYEAQGQDTVRLLAGYFMSFEFDKEAYSPGDTITIKYEITARGDTTLPATFVISYGLANGPHLSKQTTSAKGSLKYKIPDGIDEGHQLFSVIEGSTAGATEVVYIRSGLNPFEWARVGDMPLMEILLLILVIILFILVLRPRGPAKAAAPPVEEPAPAKPKPEPAPVEEAGPSPMIINCKACGAPIELTTSKRPLEVMCPSCGETEMVQ